MEKSLLMMADSVAKIAMETIEPTDIWIPVTPNEWSKLAEKTDMVQIYITNPMEFRPYLLQMGFKFVDGEYVKNITFDDETCFRRRELYANMFCSTLKNLDRASVGSTMMCRVRVAIHGITSQELLELQAKHILRNIMEDLDII